MNHYTRRRFLRQLGLSAATVPFLPVLPSLAEESATPPPVRRVVFIFTPNGTVPWEFWPDQAGPDFQLKRILQPLAPFRDRMLILKGISNKIRGDGDGHMRGMSCLLTADKLLPGNIQGGSDKPAGWAANISIDQQIKNFLQSDPATATRFGSLEIGVGVPNRADPWTRVCYAGANQPVAPLNDPYALFDRLYGSVKNRQALGSVLDTVRDDLRRIAVHADPIERNLLERHLDFVRDMERDLQQPDTQKLLVPAPVLEQGVVLNNDGIPKISRMQCALLANALANGLIRVATLQYTNSVGEARMRWLGINDGHHHLSHEPDKNEQAQESLVKINTWFAEEIAHLAQTLADTPEPAGEGSLLDHTTLIWTNELGKGNTHTLDDIPFVLIGGGLGFPRATTLEFDRVPHNRLWLTLAAAFGQHLDTFGNPDFCHDGPLVLN